MKLISPVIGCLILTCIIVHTCMHIEVLNARCGYYLPRTDLGGGNPKWRVAAEELVRRNEEATIARTRQANFHAAYPDQEMPDESEYRGPPYSPIEQARIDEEVDHNRRNSALRVWVGGMGLLQYVLAPAALLWSGKTIISDRPKRDRLLATCCGLLNAICIALMVYRGYWSSLGW